MAKWGTYPPDEQLRLKRAAAEEMFEALGRIIDLDHHNMGRESRATTIAREAYSRARGAA